MLIYKGINYLDNALQRRQRLLQNCILSAPQHLEHVDQYVHSGKLSDNKFREPWKRAAVDKKLLQSEGEKLEAEVRCLSELLCYQIKEIESFGRDTFDGIEHGVFDLGDFVPSSNPSSQEDFGQDLSPVDLDTKDVPLEKEIFKKENLQDWLPSCVGDSLRLEEVLLCDRLAAMSRHSPTLSALQGRLHPNAVSDPLDVNNPELLALKGSNENMSPDSSILSICETPLADIQDWQKFQLHANNGELEECLSPVNHEHGNDEAIIPSTGSAVELDTSADVEVNGSPPDLLQGLIKNDVDQKMSNEVETVSNGSPAMVLQTFLEINEPDCDDDIDVKKALLDSPMVGSVLDTTPTNSVGKLLDQLYPEPSTGSNNSFLTPLQQEEIVWKIWQHEKYFDDVLALRFPEPEGRPKYDIDIGPTRAKEMLSLTLDEDLGKIELCLGWDAVSASAARLKGHGVEPLGEMDHDRDKDVTLSPVELFHRDNSSVEIEDPILKVQRPVAAAGNVVDVIGHTTAEPVGSKKPSLTLSSKELSRAGGDPLADFLMLRSVPGAMRDRGDIRHTSHKHGVSHQITKGRVKTDSPQMSLSDLDLQREGTAESHKRQKTWHSQSVSVTLKGEFATSLDIIEDQVSYYMAALRSSGDIAASQAFTVLTPDTTRFLLKQKEKTFKDSNTDGSTCDSYKAIIILHTLCGARDVLVHCGFESALAHIKAMQENYQSILKNCMDDMRKKLFQLKCTFHQRRIFHPKFVSLYRQIDERIQNSSKDGKESPEKFLIVTDRDLPSLKCSLRDFLCGGSNIKAEILYDMAKDNILKRLELANCLICHGAEITADFPWMGISAVMDYDLGDSGALQSLCKSHSRPLITFSVRLEDVRDGATQQPVVDQSRDVSTCVPLTIIGSRYLTSKPELLQLLETRHQLTILERDYDQIESVDKLYFADLVVDERTCLVVQSLQDMSEVWHVEPFVTRIVALSLKFSTCWVVFYTNNNTHKSKYSFSGSYVENIIKFHAAIGNFTSKQDFTVKTFISDRAADAASFARKVCDMSRTASSVWAEGQWGTRTWLTEEFSKEEKTLLTFPCFNSFSAQLVLQKMSLNDLLTSPYGHLVSTFPWIPEKFLRLFCEIVHRDSGLQLRSEPTHTDITSESVPAGGVNKPSTKVYNTANRHHQDPTTSHQQYQRHVSEDGLSAGLYKQGIDDCRDVQHPQTMVHNRSADPNQTTMCGPYTSVPQHPQTMVHNRSADPNQTTMCGPYTSVPQHPQTMVHNRSADPNQTTMCGPYTSVPQHPQTMAHNQSAGPSEPTMCGPYTSVPQHPQTMAHNQSAGPSEPTMCGPYTSVPQHPQTMAHNQSAGPSEPTMRGPYTSVPQPEDTAQDALLETSAGTHGSQDMLSLTPASQPLVRLNEFERAEMEGKQLSAYRTCTQGDSWKQQEVISNYTSHSNEDLCVQDFLPCRTDTVITEQNGSIPGFNPVQDDEDAFEQAVNLEVARRLKEKEKERNISKHGAIKSRDVFSRNDVMQTKLSESVPDSLCRMDTVPSTTGNRLSSGDLIRSILPPVGTGARIGREDLHQPSDNSALETNLTQSTLSHGEKYLPRTREEIPYLQSRHQQLSQISTSGYYPQENMEKVGPGGQMMEGNLVRHEKVLGIPMVGIVSGRQMEAHGTLMDVSGRQVFTDKDPTEQMGQEERMKSSHYPRSFASDLGQVTRNILRRAVSSELPRAGLACPPHPRISIGLAQPRRRQDSTDTVHDQHQLPQPAAEPQKSDITPVKPQPTYNTPGYHTSAEQGQYSAHDQVPVKPQLAYDVHGYHPTQVERGQYAPQDRQPVEPQPMYDTPGYHPTQTDQDQYTPQDPHPSSLWLSYDSPPMDLSPDIRAAKMRHLRPQQTFTKRPPLEKKLTYKRVPGSKGGQTKLIFKT